MLKFLPALDQTLELEAVITCTNPPPPEAIGPGEDLEERTRKLGNPSLGRRISGKVVRRRRSPGRLSCRRQRPWSHPPPWLNPGWVSPMSPHHFRPNNSSSCGAAMAAAVPVSQRPVGSPPSILPVTAEIRKQTYPFTWWIWALHRHLDGSSFINSVSRWTMLPCTRSMKPWTYFMEFSIQK
jgi:hypothetical protein